MGSTGSRPESPARRAALRVLVLSPLGLVALPPRATARDYASAAEVLEDVDRLEADAAARLRAIVSVVPGAQPFADSVLAAHERHRSDRARVRASLGLPPGTSPGAGTASDRSLAGLRAAQEALVYAHAEGLPALGDAVAVDVLARHMVVEAGFLTVIDLWIEKEEQGG